MVQISSSCHHPLPQKRAVLSCRVITMVFVTPFDTHIYCYILIHLFFFFEGKRLTTIFRWTPCVLSCSVLCFSMCSLLSLLGEIIFLSHHCVSFSAFLAAYLGCFPPYKPLNNSQIQPSLVTILKSQIKWFCQLNKLSSLTKKKINK